jgi:type III pantothenate kinase
MNLVIDSGNTRSKVAFFLEERLVEKHFFSDKAELKRFLNHQTFACALVSSVSLEEEEILNSIQAEKKYVLKHTLPLPIKIKYKTPETLGVDRLAAVCGAMDIFPGKNCLAIDAGTCITYDLLDQEKNYLGGAISPGLAMRFKAMHTFTRRLPLVSAGESEKLIGDSTESCMRSGVLNGAIAEMEGMIKKYSDLYPGLGVVLCGGDFSYFENNLKPPIFAAPDLVLSGLNRILLHNAVL